MVNQTESFTLAVDVTLNNPKSDVEVTSVQILVNDTEVIDEIIPYPANSTTTKRVSRDFSSPASESDIPDEGPVAVDLRLPELGVREKCGSFIVESGQLELQDCNLVSP